MNKKYSAIICIYTCSNHEEYNLKIKSSDWYKKISNDNNFKIIFVYADKSINKKFLLKGNNLYLNTEENYLNLSVKTFMMIKYCLKIFNFDYLIKIDSSLIEYKSYNEKLSFDSFEKWFYEKKWRSSYSGIFLNKDVSIKSINYWKNSKGIKKRCKIFKLYKKDKVFNYYSGKAYSISKSNCKKVISNKNAINYKLYMYGIEDIMISEAIK